jgi:hypothetical protein
MPAFRLASAAHDAHMNRSTSVSGVVLRRRQLAVVVIGVLSAACEPDVVVGRWICSDRSASTNAIQPMEGIVTIPWNTGFEDGFCDYERAGGYCYSDPEGSYAIVDSPVHSGASRPHLRS